jgi:hypothetical protein
MKIALGEEIVWSTTERLAYHEACTPANAEFSTSEPVQGGGYVGDSAPAAKLGRVEEFTTKVARCLRVVLDGVPGATWGIVANGDVEVALHGYRERIRLTNFHENGRCDMGTQVCLTPEDVAREVAARLATAAAEMAMSAVFPIAHTTDFHRHELARVLAGYPGFLDVWGPQRSTGEHLTVWTRFTKQGRPSLHVIPCEDELGWTVVPNTEGARGTRCAHLYAVATVAREWLDSLAEGGA